MFVIKISLWINKINPFIVEMLQKRCVVLAIFDQMNCSKVIFSLRPADYFILCVQAKVLI